MKPINECIEFCKKKIDNNQNVEDVENYLSIIEHLKNSDRFEMIKKAYFDLFDKYTKSQVEKDITEGELEALYIGYKL